MAERGADARRILLSVYDDHQPSRSREMLGAAVRLALLASSLQGFFQPLRQSRRDV